MIVQQNVSLKPYNTFKIDENTNSLAIIDTIEDLDEIYQTSRFHSQRKMILGSGSNVLFTRGFAGIIVKNQIQGIQIESETSENVVVSVGSGENWHQFVLWCVERGYGGIENLSLIPGTVGAAPIQNIGAYGVEIKEVFLVLEAYEIKTAKTVLFFKEDCKFGYRQSIFKRELKNKYVITKVFFKLTKKSVFTTHYEPLKIELEKIGLENLTLKNVSQTVINIRQSKLPDPIDIGNVGSFFKNPIIETLHFEALEAQFPNIKKYPLDTETVKIPAGWLIENAGWKGYRKGDIGVHHSQALVLINHGNGRGKDVLDLSNTIKNSIQKKFGIELECEVNII